MAHARSNSRRPIRKDTRRPWHPRKAQKFDYCPDCHQELKAKNRRSLSAHRASCAIYKQRSLESQARMFRFMGEFLRGLFGIPDIQTIQSAKDKTEIAELQRLHKL